MESRNSNKRSDVLKTPVADAKVSDYNYIRKSLRSRIDAHIVYYGTVTGEKYEWSRAGAIASVDERDVPELLTKRLGAGSCCGTSNSNIIFELI